MFQRLLSPFSRLSHNTISLWIVGVLLFLRVPFLGVVSAIWEQSQNAATVIYFPITYLLTAFLIWWERERLREFWFDLVSGIIFICQFFMFPFGIGMFAAMRRSKARFPTPPAGLLLWSLAGGLLAILLSILTMQMHWFPAQPRSENPAGLGLLFGVALIQMLNAAVFEEPLFRGFLWGHLRLLGWKNVWIWVLQALLFTLAHVYYLRTEPFALFFARLMLSSLLIGLIAWRARSIAASMVTHGFYNAVSDQLMHSSSLEDALRVAWTGAGVIAILLLLAFGFAVYQRRRIPATASQ